MKKSVFAAALSCFLFALGVAGVCHADVWTNPDRRDLMKSAIVSECSGAHGFQSSPVYLIDGNLATKWCEIGSASELPYVVIDLQEARTFNAYRLVHAGFMERDAYNTKAWRVSWLDENAHQWRVLDEVSDSAELISVRGFDSVTARYVRLDVLMPEQQGFTARLNEFELLMLSDDEKTARECGYRLMLDGDWDQLEDATYITRLERMFYEVYPRLAARWGQGAEQKTVVILADATYAGVAATVGWQRVIVSPYYLNDHSWDIGCLAHELVHMTQCYQGMQSSWWIENLANYGGIRYYHWAETEYLDARAIVDFNNDLAYRDYGYEPYGHCDLFFSWMDARYPTVRLEDGTLRYGLIDSIHFAIRNGEITSDALDDAAFCGVVKSVTGQDGIEPLRLQFVGELERRAWQFYGFAEYGDNWMTEHIKGVANPTYAVQPPLESAVVKQCSGYIFVSERPLLLVDGNGGSKWCARQDDVSNPDIRTEGVQHSIVLDLGEVKTFDAYHLLHAGTREPEVYNTKAWEVYWYDAERDAWTLWDRRENRNENITRRSLNTVSARYVRLDVLDADQMGYGVVRLYEFALYHAGRLVPFDLTK